MTFISRLNATNPSTTCTGVEDKCLKISINYWQGYQVIKSCIRSESCTNFNMLIAGYGVSSTCCSGDDCNILKGGKG